MAGTPQVSSRRVPAAPDSTKPAAPVRNPGHPALNVTPHAAAPAVTGPPAWENGRDAVSTPRGGPPHKNPGASFRPHSDAQPTRTAGVNPDPPA